tara:strand:- start:414 stop:812 length:399 start_codon:yes stop_codon:yes gene_type:complete
MQSKKLNKSNVLDLIKEEADFILKKEEYHSKITQINEDIKGLYENRDFVGTFGFEGDNKSKSVSGFVETPNISYIAQLEKEFAAQDSKNEEAATINEDELNEIDQLKKENSNLKKQMEEISAFISEMKKADK